MIACFDIGGTTIKAALAEAPGRLRVLGRVPTPRTDFDAFAAAVSDFVGADEGTVALSITGVVDPGTGTIRCANIPCIDGLALGAELERRLGRRVVVGNDADCFTLAEAKAGAGAGHRIVFGTILGTGVGGGLAVDGRLVTGAGGLTGEWGHGPVIAEPLFACGCGLSGCVDTIGGARGMERLHRHLHGLAASSLDIVAAWETGDAAAGRTIAAQIGLLAGPLALAVNITGAHMVPVGGGLAGATRFVAALDEAVRARILRRCEEPLVVPGRAGPEPGLLGAALLGFGDER